MIQIIDKNDVVHRKPYMYSSAILSKIARIRKSKKLKRERLANSITKINMLTEFIRDDIIRDIDRMHANTPS